VTGNRSKTVRIIEISELLDVSKQRAHQIADVDRFPIPIRASVKTAYRIGARSRRGRSVGPPGSTGISRRSAIGVRAAEIPRSGPR
jgi:hypothetical protein